MADQSSAYVIENGTPSGADVTPTMTNVVGISWGTAGTLKVDTPGSSAVTFASGELAANVIHPIQVTKVYDTGTTAANIKLYGYNY